MRYEKPAVSHISLAPQEAVSIIGPACLQVPDSVFKAGDWTIFGVCGDGGSAAEPHDFAS